MSKKQYDVVAATTVGDSALLHEIRSCSEDVLLDLFAMSAMNGLLAAKHADMTAENIAAHSYQYADAMLNVRKTYLEYRTQQKKEVQGE